MAQSTTAIQLKSDLKRGVRSKGFKLTEEIISLIADLSDKTGKPQSAVISEAIRLYAESLKEGANKQVISSQADSLIKISRIWADFFPANTSNQPI
ncbi:hypothetical protein V5080_00005 [Atlantibacter hermannii]|uniref:hypothetical protein n=1 Tax=Atlantibacter hermannii TaxID=565 RepID=UPI00307675A6